MQRLLITGAAGALGVAMRERLADLAPVLRLSDLKLDTTPAPHEEQVACDLADEAAVHDLVKGCDAIIHLGGYSVEGPWDTILNANIRGTYHIYEAARRHGCRRILFASSSHAVGFYPRTQHLDTTEKTRPDTLYGLSKAFGENLASLYWDKHGIESVALRIGASAAVPPNRRHATIYLSFDDMARLARAVFAAERVGFTIMYGISDNPGAWWDNRLAGHIGYEPRDSSAEFRDQLHAANPQADPDDPSLNFQGGPFAIMPHFED